MSQPDQTGLAWSALRNNGWNGAAAIDGPVTNGGVRSAIARAAQSTGVDFSYLAAQAKLESSMNPNARAATSSASGLYQFTNATWMQTLQKHGDMLGLDAGGSGGTLAALSDPAARAQLLALRSDPNASAMMAASLASDNQTALTGVLGRTPDASELYLAHFLGADGASKFLTALATNPDQSAAALLPKAAAANGSIFFDANGQARSLGQMMALLRGKMDSALQTEGAAGSDPTLYAGMATAGGTLSAAVPGAAPEDVSGGPIARQFAAARQDMAAGATTSSASMADTLQAAFGSESSAATPDFVRSAYGRLRAFGL